MRLFALFACLHIIPLVATAGATLSAEVKGSTSPAVALCTTTGKGIDKTVTNGDFEIVQPCTGHPENREAGDGFNEHTYWTFDLTRDPDWAAHAANCKIDSALVEIQFVATKQTASPTASDFLRVRYSWDFGLADIQNSGPGEKRRLRFEMLNNRGYLWNLDKLIFKDHAGQLPMHYSDDAIVFQAALTVECQ